ncbi:hypothetical protein JCM6294_1486 [Bacteroides pyogenes DSM 20611 = JCM 6294]|uniref:Uncharacterized protein n=1 Tax=Bacteroides pyogenes DSM 20611 = JCM 6294 TaxID=1121100 RepID=W4PFI5_9BACE|nr:hypothetical protein JCM6294_1486 [Bacteroides pyogenes DSM 20611 = JCM 6294]
MYFVKLTPCETTDFETVQLAKIIDKNIQYRKMYFFIIYYLQINKPLKQLQK